MVEPISPLGSSWRPGSHGDFASGVGVTLSETRPGSIVQVHAWPGQGRTVMDALKAATSLTLPDGAGAGAADGIRAVFGIGPGRFLAVDQAEGLAEKLSGSIPADSGVVTDLSHGRTAIRIAGPKAEWVLSKLFALDFSQPAFPEGAGRATMHHDVFAQIQRTGPEQFDLYVFRSFARSFWTLLCHLSEPEGYIVK